VEAAVNGWRVLLGAELAAVVVLTVLMWILPNPTGWEVGVGAAMFALLALLTAWGMPKPSWRNERDDSREEP
jgi:hypothetical protein